MYRQGLAAPRAPLATPLLESQSMIRIRVIFTKSLSVWWANSVRLHTKKWALHWCSTLVQISCFHCIVVLCYLHRSRSATLLFTDGPVGHNILTLLWSEKPELHVRKASHCGSKQQQRSCAEITLLLLVGAIVVLCTHPIRGESHIQCHTTGEVATTSTPFYNEPHRSHVLCVKAELGATFTSWSQHHFVAIGKAWAACAQSFTLWQQATTEIMRQIAPQSLNCCLFTPHIYMLLFFAHIPFVVNHTFNATPLERLQQHPRTDRTFFVWRLNSARPSHPGHSTILLRSCYKSRPIEAFKARF